MVLLFTVLPLVLVSVFYLNFSLVSLTAYNVTGAELTLLLPPHSREPAAETAIHTSARTSTQSYLGMRCPLPHSRAISR